MLSGRLHSLEERVDGDTAPDRVELRPLRHAMDVDGDLLARQRAELVPRPRARLVHFAADREVPDVEGRVGGWAGGQHRIVRRHVLAGRDARLFYVRAPTAVETPGDK